MRKRTLTADERKQARGSSSVLTHTVKGDCKYPRRESQDRTVTITRPGKATVYASARDASKLRGAQANLTVVAEPRISKRSQLAAGAQYAETWQTAHAAPSSNDPTPTTYHLDGIGYATYDEWQAALERKAGN